MAHHTADTREVAAARRVAEARRVAAARRVAEARKVTTTHKMTRAQKKTEAQKGRALLQLARKAIESYFTKQPLRLEQYEQYNERRGVFVTLTSEGELRGCIGYITSNQPLYKMVVYAARAAAFEDPRFPPLQPEELGEIRIEVSLLTTPKEVRVASPEEYLKKIKIGRDGLLLKQGFRTGLLLPQVPVEYGWNVETYLEHLCRKAGLPQDAWKEPGTRIESFQAEIYREESAKQK